MKKAITFLLSVLLFSGCNQPKIAENVNLTDANTPLHALQPDYEFHYGPVSPEEIKVVLNKVFNYLNEVTPAYIINSETKEKIIDITEPVKEAILAQGDFRLTSYEWGVTYAGMINASVITGDVKYKDYVKSRLDFLSKIKPYFELYGQQFPELENPLHQVINPAALDDAGSVCAAIIKAQNAGIVEDMNSMINNYMDWIYNKQFRLKDGTLARNRPFKNTLWLDDLFMSVPALAQMTTFCGEKKYLDDAVKQVKQFSKRMFNTDKGLFFHGWVQEMEIHPQYHWARANGWALMAMVELLSTMPDDHPEKKEILNLLKAHISGLIKYQSANGLWHQLIDKSDSYLETSATAIYTYSIAKAINEGWIDASAFGPVALLAWNGITKKINDKGQVEGTCVGTGMAFDPAFYYYRPVNAFAAHGYGPVLLAGSEMIKLIMNFDIKINDSAVHFYNFN